MKLNNNITQEILEIEQELKNKELLEDKQEIIKELSKLLINAVDKRIKGKVGIAFSAGLDSSLIALITSKLKKDFKLYCVGLQNSPDLEYAMELSIKMNWPIRFKILTLEEAESTIKKIVSILKDTNVIKVGVACPEYHVLQMAKEDGIKTVLTGLGAEEIFAGYNRHLKSKDIQEESWRGFKEIYENDLIRDLAIANHFNINVECPFLDRDLIKYAMQIPPKLKIKDGIKKYILIETAIKLGLPKKFALRPKKAAQYGSNFDKAIESLSKKYKFKSKTDYLLSLR